MYYHKFDKKLKEQYFNVWKFSNHDKNRFNLLLQNDVSPYEYMDDWEKFNETSLPKKEDCYSHLNMEDKYGLVQIMLTKKELVKMLKLKIYENDLYVQSDTLFLHDVFENFRNLCIEICKLDPEKFLLAPILGWQAALQKTKVKLDLLFDISMLLMIGKGIKGGICSSIY